MTTLDEKIKSTLTPGTLIRFHNWAIGGFLFGIVTACEEEPYTHNRLHVWRPRATYSLDDINAITVIKSMDDVPEYAISDLQEFLFLAKNNVVCNFDENRAIAY